MDTPWEHDIDTDSPNNWKYRCKSCGNVVTGSPDTVCANCQGEMERIMEEGHDVEAYQ